MFIPAAQLPDGFVDQLHESSAHPVQPRPAATVVLMRDGEAGPEVLLQRRTRNVGFVPGAWVFPGGRVDAADGDPALWTGQSPPLEPAPEYWAAALRELFEEAGILLAQNERGEYAPDTRDAAMNESRAALLANRVTLHRVLEERRLRIALEPMVYFSHWITPLPEPRRYDTRFFLAALPPGRTATANVHETSASAWLTPAAALQQFADGRLPMVFPTVRTLEGLAGFAHVNAALQALRGRSVTPVLPRLVRTIEGVSLLVDEASAGGNEEDHDGA